MEWMNIWNETLVISSVSLVLTKLYVQHSFLFKMNLVLWAETQCAWWFSDSVKLGQEKNWATSKSFMKTYNENDDYWVRLKVIVVVCIFIQMLPVIRIFCVSVLTCAACLILGWTPRDHVADLKYNNLCRLHVPQQIIYKLCLIP